MFDLCDVTINLFPIDFCTDLSRCVMCFGAHNLIDKLWSQNNSLILCYVVKIHENLKSCLLDHWWECDNKKLILFQMFRFLLWLTCYLTTIGGCPKNFFEFACPQVSYTILLCTEIFSDMLAMSVVDPKQISVFFFVYLSYTAIYSTISCNYLLVKKTRVPG